MSDDKLLGTGTVNEISEVDSNGCVQVEIDFDDDFIESFALAWIKRNMESASVSVMDDMIAEGKAYNEAVYRAVINQAIIDAIREGIKADKLENSE